MKRLSPDDRSTDESYIETNEQHEEFERNEASLTELAERHSSNSDEEVMTKRPKNRILSDSDSEDNDTNKSANNKIPSETSDSDDSNEKFQSCENDTPRPKINSDSSNSGNDLDSSPNNHSQHKSNKNVEQQLRMKNKKSKLTNKFRNLIKSRERNGKSSDSSSEQNKTKDINLSQEISLNQDDHKSDDSDADINSIERIKEIIKNKSIAMKTTLLYDPDTSDDENGADKQSAKKSHTTKKTLKKPSSSKSQRMSAKEAMENMQKIKSESNRMLREKEVSLPYHRPKALSLKDIMSRRKPALSVDGKTLPIKMNEEQLRQYALSLEQRQKEVIELCKSDTDEEENTEADNKGTDIDDKQLVDKKEEDNDRSYDALVLNGVDNDESMDTSDKTTNDIQNEITAQDNIHTKLNESFPNAEEPESMNHNSNDEDNVIYDKDCNESKKENSEEKCDETEEKQAETEELNYVGCIDEENQENKIDKSSYTEKYTSVDTITEKTKVNENDKEKKTAEEESQLISLHYDSENINSEIVAQENDEVRVTSEITSEKNENETNDNQENINSFSDEDDEFNLDEIDRMIENADILKDSKEKAVDSPMLIRDNHSLITNPKITGAPGMVIDLDGSAASQPKKLSGVELLKQRFCYFSNLKTPEEKERDREQRIKPGNLHQKLKQELADQMAEQRHLEWSKRLEEEKQQHDEMNAIRGDGTDDEDDLEKIESKLEEIEETVDETNNDDSESEEEPEENDVEMRDDVKSSNPLIDDEAEESDCDEVDHDDGPENEANDIDDNVSENESSEDESSSEEEVEDESKLKKGRILKAFEDSDDENVVESNAETQIVETNTIANDLSDSHDNNELQSAQLKKVTSEDIFESQSDLRDNSFSDSKDLGLKSLNVPIKDLDSDKLTVICESQPCSDDKFDDIVGLCSGSFSQNLVDTQKQASQTQDLGDDVLALCTGKFYDNEFVDSQDDKENNDTQNLIKDDKKVVEVSEKENKTVELKSKDDNVLKSILDELNDPELDKAKENKFFMGSGSIKNKKEEITEMHQKKRCIIDSDDDDVEETKVDDRKKKRKRKLQERALQISDDEDVDEEQTEDIESELDDDDAEKIIEYDSEENEVEIQPITVKKKRKIGEFFEQEAELTSEDEWVGSGDEDEAGLDRMEREEGDDDHFHQGTLRRELEQIHMRDQLDQDKREVRLLQELLLEDGDLGGGHRQRKFKWRNADGEEMAVLSDMFGESQEEEFESEEQWRKQRHEREVFLKQLMQKDETENEPSNITINRTAIIKANLNSSKNISSLLLEMNSSVTTTEVPQEKKTNKHIPSPTKKPYLYMKQNHHNSFLGQSRNSLEKLAALATPIARDSSDDNANVANIGPGKGNFVFSAVSPDVKEKPKAKRKAVGNTGTPQLMKKLKTEEKQLPTNSLLDFMKS